MKAEKSHLLKCERDFNPYHLNNRLNRHEIIIEMIDMAEKNTIVNCVITSCYIILIRKNNYTFFL